MAKMTKKDLATLESLYKAAGIAQAAVFTAAPDDRTPFDKCYALASLEVQEEYQYRARRLEEFKCDMIAMGKAWRNSIGGFQPNY